MKALSFILKCHYIGVVGVSDWGTLLLEVRGKFRGRQEGRSPRMFQHFQIKLVLMQM